MGRGHAVNPLLLTTGKDPAAVAAKLEEGWQQGRMVGLAAPAERFLLAEALGEASTHACSQPQGAGVANAKAPGAHGAPFPGTFGPGVVVGSGGSTGGRRWCVQPLRNLQESAAATGSWLRALGIDPAACLVVNPLPLHHVSGLLPVVRARQWGAELRWLAVEWMRDPDTLTRTCPLPRDRPVVISLVPTQLHRLMASPAGLRWLRRCSVIWVGGSSLSEDLAHQARQAGLPLAPCYGATETAAMVCALSPQEFLSGVRGCGPPLDQVNIRIDPNSSAIELITSRLSPGVLESGRLMPLSLLTDGWWRSGDGGEFRTEGLVVQGRMDGAILSGGETVFPEQVENRLLHLAHQNGVELLELLLLGIASPRWGERLVGLYRGGNHDKQECSRPMASMEVLRANLMLISKDLPPSQRPTRWLHCPSLARDHTGKWARGYWSEWVSTHHFEQVDQS